MPPKKKKKGKGGKGKKKNTEKASDPTEEKFERSRREVEILKDRLALQREGCRRAEFGRETWRGKASQLETELKEKKEEENAVSSELTRQYKTMHGDLSLRVRQLESDVQYLRGQLEESQRSVREERAEREKLSREKLLLQTELQDKMELMEEEYERTFHAALDALVSRLDTAKAAWEPRVALLHAKHKRTLQQHGLAPLSL
ncbi:dynein regulatory complex protein 12 isoform X2 [Petromyzon marinus]|uniref:dynein regulatory complex protein 12 isoform X1 n=1 Tax=Petromyzon marinus TaxID=7757 RepID=UPI003F730FE4